MVTGTRSLEALRKSGVSIYTMVLQLFPLLLGAVTILVLLLSGQGRELVQISNEQNHSILVQIAIAVIPIAYAFITLLIGFLFNAYRKYQSGKSEIESFLFSNFAAFTCALTVPLIVLVFFPSSATQKIIGFAFFILGAAFTYVISHRMALDHSSINRLIQKIELVTLCALILGCCGLALLVIDVSVAIAVGTLGVTIAALAVWTSLMTIVFGLLPIRFGWSTKYGLCALCQ
jgi:hypothetical protein